MESEQKPTKSEALNAFCLMFRAITRPAVTIIFAAVIAQVVIDRIDAPQWFLGLATACILWWFGDRTVQHIKTKTPTESGEKKGGTNAQT
jgi:hypothetical protein